MSDETASLERARVKSRPIPVHACDLRTLAAGIRLDWVKACSLWTAGFLSFDPDAVLVADGVREAEFVFVGSLAAAGLSHETLDIMLRGLRKPYAYDGNRIYFDWRARCWRLLPGPADPESAFFALLARLDPQREARALLEIRELADTALDLASGRSQLFGHEGAASSASDGPSHRG